MLPLAILAIFALGPQGSAGVPETIPASAIALADSTSPTAAEDLVNLALGAQQARSENALHPLNPLVLETLARYYHAHPPAAQGGAFRLPDLRLRAYASATAPEARAAFAFLCAVLKDPAAVPSLLQLSADADPSVRRAAALALADRTPKSGGPTARSGSERAACVAALRALLKDRSIPVRIAASRAVASYGAASVSAAPEAIALLAPLLHHADFNLRVAAIEGLTHCVPATGRLGDHAGFPTAALLTLVRYDRSTSVRYSAALALATFDPATAAPCVAALLASAGEYDRTAACEVLGKVATPAAWSQLAQLASHDPALRVRETALTELALPAAQAAPVTRAATVAALADRDPEIFAGGCQIAQNNRWTDLASAIAAGLTRFTGGYNADARIAALTSLAELEATEPATSAAAHVRDLAYAHDANPGVRMAALAALAMLDHRPPPELSRGADLIGNLYPGGKPTFGPRPLLVLQTDRGEMKILLFPAKAPITCGHVAALARAGFYNGLTWHRVVPDFVIQGGCPRGDGSGNAGVTLPLESTDMPFERGTLGMPRDSHPDTGGCQLFICHSRVPHLDVGYCAFGQVVEGLDVIDRIDVDCRILSARVEGLQ
jgi:peptidyl-prolyl cis-trans isomerase B (cyclophilin B)